MSQDYTDNVYDTSFIVDTTMTNIEKNFAALKSCFSGTVAPADTIAGMWWLDTTNHILKIRDEANAAWYSVWDMVNNKPVITNLSGDITLAMISAALQGPAAGSFGLRKLGTATLEACAGDDTRLSDTRIPTDFSVSQAKLKTTTGSVSVYMNGTNTLTGALPGGEYAFRLQVKSDAHDGSRNFGGYYYDNVPTSYVSPCAVFAGGGVYGYAYAQERYVQACGEVHWIFSLRERETGIIIKNWQAPDHICFGNGGDPKLVQHPYGDYDEDKYELIVINPPLSFMKTIQKRAGRLNDPLEIINKEYIIDDLSNPPFPKEKVAVALPEDWEDSFYSGQQVEDIKSIIPKPKQAVTRVLKRK